MGEMGEALRSCMERLVIAREEREQIIVEAANEISSEKKRVRELQQKLEDANKKLAKLAAENNHLANAVDSKDALIGELRESAAAAGDKLADATARLESAQKQAVSLQYEVRMLQKELEVRGQEREYDLKSVDAARRQQAEHLKRIAELEAECQRLRAMVRKRLPGPAAIAKMRDEVDQPLPTTQSTPTSASASPRRPRPATTLSSPRSGVAPLSPRPSSPRRSVSDADAFKLRAVEDENRALKQALAKRENELQFVQMKYADEACKLTVAQRQLKELTEENRQLSDANSQSESWASALISELDKFRSGNQNGGASIMASSSCEMNLLDDFVEIEKLEMVSGDQKRNAQCASPKKADTGLVVTQEQNGNGPVLDGRISNGHPEKVKNIWELVVQKHEASGQSVETIIEQISQALDQAPTSAERDDSDAPSDRSEIEKAVRNMVEEINSMIHTSAADNVARSRALSHDKSELFRHLEHLVQVCHDLLEGKCNPGKFIDEVCLVLKYIVSQYFSDQDQTGTVNSNAENFDGAKSSTTVTANGTHDTESAKPSATSDVQKEAGEEPVQSVESQIMANHVQKPDTELIHVTQAQDDSILPGRKSAYCEIKSPAAEASMEQRAAQEESHLVSNLEILAAADKLAECQETITILSKQLQALSENPRLSSAAASDYKPQSLGSILAEEFANAEASISMPPTTPKQQVLSSKKDEGDEVYATPRRSAAQQKQQEENAGGDGDKDEMQTIAVHPVFNATPPRQDNASTPPRQDDASADPKRRKKRGTSLLGRIMFRKRVEGGS